MFYEKLKKKLLIPQNKNHMEHKIEEFSPIH